MREPLMEARSVSLAFYGTSVLESVDLELCAGEVHALLGENGAGKSSLVKVLSGSYRKESGTILLDGKEVDFRSPREAFAHGVAALHQESMIFDHLSVADNIFVHPWSLEPGARGRRERTRRAQEALDALCFDLDASAQARRCSLTQKRMIEIARIAVESPRVLLLDEPLAGINRDEVRSLICLLEVLMREGCAILYATHSMKDISEIAQRVTIMRDGRVVQSIEGGPISSIGKSIDSMVWGDYHAARYPKLKVRRGEEALRVERLGSPGRLSDVSMSLRRGEILGIAGLADSGKVELAAALFGLVPASEGSILVDGGRVRLSSPADALKLGIVYVTDDRYDDGLFMNLSAVDNACVLERYYRRSALVRRRRDEARIRGCECGAQVDLGDTEAGMLSLSGGTQQKIMLLRAFASKARILILNDPTRGVDIASRVDIYNLMGDVVRKGGAIILVSSSFEELSGMSDRILVMRGGRVVHEADREDEEGLASAYSYAVTPSPEKTSV